MSWPIFRVRAALLAVALLAAACSGNASESAATEPTAAPADNGAREFDDAEAATEPTATLESTEPTATPEPTPARDPLTVETTAGPVTGVPAADVVASWLAIPYAVAPTGDNRWRPPSPPEPWVEPVKAIEPGASCSQGEGGITATLVPAPPASEDCLTLSVWAPTNDGEVPVMVWFHGGGLSSGSAHSALYDGTSLATKGMVIVGVNYRLGTLGFLSHPDAAAENDGVAGNYGILDQALALEWVRDNIVAFGGDPDNVTIFGESGGGLAVCSHLAAEWAGDLFDKAIIQSGYGGCVEFVELDDAYAQGADIVEALGCTGRDELSCLRSLPVEDIVAVASVSNPVADDAVFTSSLVQLAESGDYPEIPLMLGSNRDEATLFNIGRDDFTTDELLEIAETAVGANAPTALILYPQPTDLERGLALSTDVTFACWTRQLAVELAGQATPVFQYEYAFASPADPFGLGATHASEVVVLFANPGGITGLPPEFDQTTLAVSDALQTAWTAFAATGTPEAPVEWEPVQNEGQPFMQIDVDWTNQTTFRDNRCDALAELG